ncbi:MAG: hypothetical protein AAGJ87_11890, partial [Pseudomonadota bacterium]
MARNFADAGVFLLSALFVAALAIAWFAQDLPSTDNLWRADRSATTTLVARTGAPLPTLGASAGAPVRLSDLPAYV